MTIDWAEAHARLDRWQLALAGAGEPSPEAAARILADRAAALALPSPEMALAPPAGKSTGSRAAGHPGNRAGSLELLVFWLAGDRYAVEAARVVEVVAPRELTPLPLAPGFLAGVVYHQGWVVPVFDLRRLLGLAGKAWQAGEPVVVVDAGGKVFALRADAIEGMRRIGALDIGPLPAAAAPQRGAWFRGLAAGMVLVIDLEALADDPRIAVDDDGARIRGGREPGGAGFQEPR